VKRGPGLAWVRDRWRAFAAFGAVVVSLVTAAIHPPPVGEPGTYVAFGGFCAAVMSGLVYVLMRRRFGRRDTYWWWAAALVAVALCAVVNLQYAAMWDRYVATYNGQRLIVGSQLTDVGHRWIDTRGQSSPSDLVFAAAGQLDLFWTPESIARTRRNLRLIYYLCYPLFALAILSVVQALHCSSQSGTRRRTPRPKSPATA
jgi:hypothetical protein